MKIQKTINNIFSLCSCYCDYKGYSFGCPECQLTDIPNMKSLKDLPEDQINCKASIVEDLKQFSEYCKLNCYYHRRNLDSQIVLYCNCPANVNNNCIIKFLPPNKWDCNKLFVEKAINND